VKTFAHYICRFIGGNSIKTLLWMWD